jgi:hypothetical protein
MPPDGGPPSGGIWYVPFGTVALGTQITTFPTRVVDIYGGQLYADGDTSSTTEVLAVGTGLPTSSTSTLTGLPGMPAQVAGGPSFTSPWEFVLFDFNPSVPGLDTLYVACDQTGATNPPGGIQKWTFNGSTWSLVTTFNLAAPLAPDGFRGLAGAATGPSSAILIASTLDNGQPPNRVALFVDDGTAASSVTLNGTVLVTSPANTVYRGVALAPL